MFSHDSYATNTRKRVLHSSSEIDIPVQRSTWIVHRTGVTTNNKSNKTPMRSVPHTHTSYDDLILITSKAQTGDPYSALLGLDDEFEDDLIKMTFYPRLDVKVIGTPNLKGKLTSKCDCTTDYSYYQRSLLPHLRCAGDQLVKELLFSEIKNTKFKSIGS